MRETQAIIERVRRVSANLQQLDLSTESALAVLQPGQSVFARVSSPDTSDPYLREQWIPVEARAGRLVVELPIDRSFGPGRAASLLAPVGRPIPVRQGIQRLLLIAEDAPPTPFVQLARQMITGGIGVTLVLGGEAIRYPLELLPPEVEIIRSDTGWKWPDQVEMLSWADQIIALAPSYNQIAVYGNLYQMVSQIRHHDIPDGFLCGLFYQRLACGTGACQVCQITCRDGDQLACVDGPAVDLKEVTFR